MLAAFRRINEWLSVMELKRSGDHAMFCRITFPASVLWRPHVMSSASHKYGAQGVALAEILSTEGWIKAGYYGWDFWRGKHGPSLIPQKDRAPFIDLSTYQTADSRLNILDN